MEQAKNELESPKRTRKSQHSEEEPICFVISPIGKEGTDIYDKFKEMLDYILKPAIENSGYKLRVIRADDIERAGSLIKDILEYVVNSFVVVADLTDQNANVFYELGVRHSLSSRTILIARSVEDIPSDLRDYRTIIYDTTAKGAALFKKRLSSYLKEIYDEPNRPDNPVLDRLGSLIETRVEELKAENISLKAQIANILQKGIPAPKPSGIESVTTRIQRIFKLENAVEQDGIFSSGSFQRTVNGEKKTIQLDIAQGNFNLYFLKTREGPIYDFWYVSVIEGRVNIEKELADIRVLMEDCYLKDTKCTFIIATNDDLSSQAESIRKAFDTIKTFVDMDVKAQKRYNLKIWDKQGLLLTEKELGIKIEI